MEPKTNITITKNGEIICEKQSHNTYQPTPMNAVWEIVGTAYDEQDDILSPSDIEYSTIIIRYEIPDVFDVSYKVHTNAKGIIAKKI